MARPSSAQGSADDHSATDSKSHANATTGRTGSNLNIQRSCNRPSEVCHAAEQCCTAKCDNSQPVPGGIAVRGVRPNHCRSLQSQEKDPSGPSVPRLLGPFGLGG